MTTTIITLPVEAIIDRLDHGKLWTKGWGDYATATGQTCLHGAIRYCQPIKGDAYLIEHVGARYGFGTQANDDAKSWGALETLVREHTDITDDMLADTFGPQWEPIVALVRRAAILTPDDLKALAAAWDAARDAAADAAWDAARAAARAAARDAALAAAWAAARDAALAAAWDAAWDAAAALVTRDLIGQRSYTQDAYDTLTGIWRRTIGQLHPDDAELT